MKLIDMHCHIIPGVDDGSRNKEETTQMLALMKAQGVVGVIVTPHYRIGMFETSMEEIQKRFRWTRMMARKHRIHLWLGTECYVRNEIISALDEKKCNTMARSRYILVEFSSIYSYNVIRQYINMFVMEGYIPIIAHIERIPCLEERWTYIRELREMGAKVQVNAESILGDSGRRTKRNMWKLMKLDLVDYIASDCHGIRERRPNLGPCYELVSKKIGCEYADRIFYHNQKKIIYDERD